MKKTNHRRFRCRSSRRRGAAATEFALVAPLFAIVLIGYGTAHEIQEAKSGCERAAYAGGRLATMENRGNWTNGETTNQRVEQDMRNFINASGLPGDDVGVDIVDADDDTVSFDLDDPVNAGELFRIIVNINFEEVSTFGVPGLDDMNLGAEVVFRNINDVGN